MQQWSRLLQPSSFMDDEHFAQDTVFSKVSSKWFSIGKRMDIFWDPIKEQTWNNEDELVQKLVAVMQAFPVFYKWAFLHFFLTLTKDSPNSYDPDQYDYFFRVVETVIDSGFALGWEPEGYDLLAARRFGAHPNFDKQSIHYMIIKFIGNCNYSNPKVMDERKKYFARILEKSAGKSNPDANAKYSRAQIVEALRKTGGNSKLAAAQLLRG